MAIIRSKIARQLLAEGGAPRKPFANGGFDYESAAAFGSDVDDFGMDFVDSSMACEFLELITISNHKKIFNGSAPLADLKYQSRTDREMRQLIKDKRTESKKRMTRFNNDDDYLNAKTNNNQNFNQVSSDLIPFLTKNPKKLKKVSYER